MNRKVFLILLSVIIYLIPILGGAVALELLEKIDQANQAYLSKNYPQAKILFEDFKKGLLPEDQKEESVRSIVNEVDANLAELDLLINWKESLNLISAALGAEKQKNLNGAVNLYLKTFQWFKAKKISEIDYFSYFTKGELESYLLKRKQENLGRFSYAFLEKIRQDKKRKKSLVIFGLTAKGAKDTNISTLVENALIGTLQRKNFFSLIRKPLGLKIEEQASWAKERGIDLYVQGTYEKLPQEVVLASFSVYDAFLDKKLIDVTMKAPMDFAFFQTIERIANDFAANLNNYSRFEDFSLIRYFKEGNRQLKKERDAEAKEDIQKYLTQKIYLLTQEQLGNLFKSGHGGKLKQYEQAAAVVKQYQGYNLSQPLTLVELIQSEKGLMFQSFDDKTDMQDFLSDMKEAVVEKDWEDYQDAYKDALEFIDEDLKPELPSFAGVLEEYKNYLAEKKAKIQEQAVNWPKKTLQTHSISIFAGSGALFSLGYTYRTPWYVDFAGTMGYAYEKQDYTEIERHALPLGLRLAGYYPLGESFEPYIFAHGFYYLGIQDYFDRLMAIGGAGIRFLDIFFVEGGYMLNKEVGVPTIGFGMRLASDKPLAVFKKAQTGAGVIVGSGALGTLFYSLRWSDFEISPTLGFIYKKDWIVNRMAMPLGLRAAYYPLKISITEPYVFASGFHYFGVQNYEARFAALAGLGTKIYTNFFVEGGYMFTKSNAELIEEENGQGVVFGAGVRLDF